MRRTGQNRRLASIFLGLFLGLLTMVTLHDFSHRAGDVQAVAMSTDEAFSTHVDEAECVLCQFVHTPFLALALSLTLVASVLGVHLIEGRISGSIHPAYQHLALLRAPPTYTLI